MDLTLTTTETDTTVTITVAGELDYYTSPRLLDHARLVAPTLNGRRLLLNMEQVRYVDSTGLTALVRIHNLAPGAAVQDPSSRLLAKLLRTLPGVIPVV